MEASELMREARRLEKKLKREPWQANLRVAVLGSASIQLFSTALRYLLAQQGIQADLYQGEYDGIAMDVFDPDSALYRFHPEVVILLTHHTDVKQYPALMEGEAETRALADGAMRFYEGAWRALGRIENCRVLQTNFAIPPEHPLGNLETARGYSRTRFLMELNRLLVERAPANVQIADVELLAGYLGKYRWFDYPGYFLSKSGFRLDCIDEIASLFVRLILALQGRTRKCLALDLDNTLWGGVVGDDGWDGIQLDPNHAVGEAYRHFQRYLLRLKERGVLLAVCSKNDEEIAKEPFLKNPNMLLRLEDIACFRANWEDKATNLRSIAKELNIGIDSLAFFDDNPAEREIVRRFLPEVHVVDVPEDPALYAQQLDREAPFEWLQITREDLLRSDSYIQNRRREDLEQQFVDYDEYLRALEMRGRVERLTGRDIGRFAQLLNKSNQFNLRTQRYSEGEIEAMLSDANRSCLLVRLRDRFSEFGIISCAILERRGAECFIESWVMSCRVLKRGVERLMFRGILDEARAMGCDAVLGEYIPTAKNAMVREFYDSLGFSLTGEADGTREYVFPAAKPFDFTGYIAEEEI